MFTIRDAVNMQVSWWAWAEEALFVSILRLSSFWAARIWFRVGIEHTVWLMLLKLGLGVLRTINLLA